MFCFIWIRPHKSRSKHLQIGNCPKASKQTNRQTPPNFSVAKRIFWTESRTSISAVSERAHCDVESECVIIMYDLHKLYEKCHQMKSVSHELQVYSLFSGINTYFIVDQTVIHELCRQQIMKFTRIFWLPFIQLLHALNSVQVNNSKFQHFFGLFFFNLSGPILWLLFVQISTFPPIL